MSVSCLLDETSDGRQVESEMKAIRRTRYPVGRLLGETVRVRPEFSSEGVSRSQWTPWARNISLRRTHALGSQWVCDKTLNSIFFKIIGALDRPQLTVGVNRGWLPVVQAVDADATPQGKKWRC